MTLLLPLAHRIANTMRTMHRRLKERHSFTKSSLQRTFANYETSRDSRFYELNVSLCQGTTRSSYKMERTASTRAKKKIDNVMI